MKVFKRRNACKLFVFIALLVSVGCATAKPTYTCTRDSLDVCVRQGRYLRKSNSHKKALEYFKRACEANDAEGCHWFAYMVRYGQGTKADMAQAVLYYKKSCDLKRGYACTHLADIYRERKDQQGASQFYDKACALNDTTGCWRFAESYRIRFGHEKAKTILVLYKKACDLGYAKSCKALKRDDVTLGPGERFIHSKCKSNVALACYHMSQQVGPKMLWLKKSCELGYRKACKESGMSYPKRVPVPQSVTMTFSNGGLKQHASIFQYCYERHLSAGGTKNKITILLVVRVKTDNTTEVKVSKMTPYLKPMDSCMREALESITYPKVTKEYLFKKTFIFKAGL